MPRPTQGLAPFACSSQLPVPGLPSYRPKGALHNRPCLEHEPPIVMERTAVVHAGKIWPGYLQGNNLVHGAK